MGMHDSLASSAATLVANATLALPPPPPSPRWFSAIGGAHSAGDVSRVFVGGTRIGEYARGDVVARDLIVVGLAADPKVHLGRLARAFEISSEMLWRVRRTHEKAGVRALVVRGRRGSERKLSAEQIEGLDACAAALAIGEKCVEGVRRLATPSGAALLRGQNAPAATWVRRVLGAFAAAGGGARMHLRMLGHDLREQEHEEEIPAVFYVDNHLRPYATLSSTEFSDTIQIDGESFGIHESRKNLGKGRGRVRRIAVRTPEGDQVNVLAVSQQPAGWIVTKMFGRWVQENAFKHGVERWGINQLDGRSTEPYPPDAVVPNPARPRLARALRIARVREGDARRELSRLAEGHPERSRCEQDIAGAIDEQKQLEALLPSTPRHARVADTELADKLVRHTAEYKVVIDTVRIACANAESELATRLGTHLTRPAEAKRVLRNLFLAPGRVRVRATVVQVELMPAATASELAAIRALLEQRNARRLTLPGDARRRQLRFGLQLD
jgi:hypothetical protein